MRVLFSKLLHERMKEDENIFFLTADLGHGLWDNIKKDFPGRYYNTGAAENLMTSIAIGLSLDGKIPVVYSITPFLLFRPYELIRNFVNYEKLPIKMVGSGRNKDYEHEGITHWAEDDIDSLAIFQNIQIFTPKDKEDTISSFNEMMNNQLPSYINLQKKYL